MCQPKTHTELIEQIFSHEERIKEKIAIYDGLDSYTYHSLEQACKTGKSFLSSLNLPANSKIAILGTRSSVYIATVLSVVAAGCSFIPIDSSYPEERIATLVSVSQVDAVICLDDSVVRDYKGVMIHVSELFSSIIPNVGIDCSQVKGNNPTLYVMYTSGSTGHPKGVQISVTSLANTLFWMQREFDVNITDRIAFKTSISFTDSIWEIFLPLLVGASIVVFHEDETLDPYRLYEKLSSHRITITQFVPAALDVFLSMIDARNEYNILPDLRWIFNGGEHPNVSLVQHLYRKTNRCCFVNIYGMTECAIYATSQMVSRPSISSGRPISSGLPIPNTEILILDGNLHHLPPNTLGEIGISGFGLANSYLHDPELTQAKFICLGGKRIYLTGDLGYLDEDGRLWYSGRKDSQVKIRGCRVELFDVEGQIMMVEGVDLAVAIVRKDSFGNNELWCWYKGTISEEKLKETLRSKLPTYMIPQHLQKTTYLPLTVNNKVDREALRQMTTIKSVAKHDIYSDIELLLISLWKEIIGQHQQFSIDDNFCDIGGDSLKAARLQIMLDNKGYSLSLSDILQCRTIRQQAKLISHKQKLLG